MLNFSDNQLIFEIKLVTGLVVFILNACVVKPIKRSRRRNVFFIGGGTIALSFSIKNAELQN
jgi:hypothetical protein